MAKLGKSVKTSSKKSFKETDYEAGNTETKTIVNDKNSYNTFMSSSDEDDAPEAVSMSTSKSQIISQIKSEREAHRLDREKKRQKAISLQEQQRKARERKAKEIEAQEDEIVSEEDEQSENGENKVDGIISPLPENILESAITRRQQIRFDSSEEEEGEGDAEFPVSSEEILETIRLQRAKANKRRLVDSLPYSVVEVGLNGKARITKAEIKARRAISKLKMQSAGAEVRRIDAVLDRARKNRTASAVFYRNNSFY